jgi:hypothetical protein
MLVLQDITFIHAVSLQLMHLIKVEWIMFEKTLNISTNPLPNHASGSGSVNALEVECSGNLKAPIMKSGCKKGSISS